MTQATATFEVKSWDEKTYQEFEDGQKFTRASVAFIYRGEVEGESSVDYLMAYGSDGAGSFVGMEHVIGRVDEREGSFVFQHIGTFEGPVVKATLTVVPGSGAAALKGLRGETAYAISGQGPYPIVFDFEFV